MVSVLNIDWYTGIAEGNTGLGLKHSVRLIFIGFYFGPTFGDIAAM